MTNIYIYNLTLNILNLKNNLNNFKNYDWILIKSNETGYSINYLNYFLKNINPNNTIIGRFGCIDNKYFQFKSFFIKCIKYPILKSGFLISKDLILKLNNFNNNFEFDIGISLINSTFIEDFKFHFFSINHKTRGNDFLLTFFPLNSSNLLYKFIHISGLYYKYNYSPFLIVDIIFGIGIFFNNSIFKINTYPIKCSSKEIFIQEYQTDLYNNLIKIKCF